MRQRPYYDYVKEIFSVHYNVSKVVVLMTDVCKVFYLIIASVIRLRILSQISVFLFMKKIFDKIFIHKKRRHYVGIVL